MINNELTQVWFVNYALDCKHSTLMPGKYDKANQFLLCWLVLLSISLKYFRSCVEYIEFEYVTLNHKYVPGACSISDKFLCLKSRNLQFLYFVAHSILFNNNGVHLEFRYTANVLVIIPKDFSPVPVPDALKLYHIQKVSKLQLKVVK